MIVALAMTVILGMCAVSIDVGQWYVKRHQAQVVADSAALAAANCLASGKCTSTSSGGDAYTVATNSTYSGNNVTVTNVSFTSSTVKVTTHGTGSNFFAGVLGIGAPSISTSATASYSSGTGISFTCAQTGSTSCESLFAGNTACDASPNIPPDYVGLDLVTNDSGGGSSSMSKMVTNGYYWNGGNSNASSFSVNDRGSSSPTCTAHMAKSGTTTFTYSATALPYPAVWSLPTCGHTAASWTTATIAAAGPGVFCITSGVTPSSCADDATGSGTILVNMGSSLPAGGYEFVGPCVTIAGWSTTATNISGQPLVYGTSNTTTAATSTSLPTCKFNNGTNLTSTWLDSSTTQAPPIFDQCGTAEATTNGGYVGFVEAWNIAIDKNNNVVGNGPTTTGGGGETTSSGGDSLTG